MAGNTCVPPLAWPHQYKVIFMRSKCINVTKASSLDAKLPMHQQIPEPYHNIVPFTSEINHTYHTISCTIIPIPVNIKVFSHSFSFILKHLNMIRTNNSAFQGQDRTCLEIQGLSLMFGDS